MAVTDVPDRKRGSTTSTSLDPFNGASFQITSMPDDVVIIEDEPEGNRQFKRFVKLKKSHWVDPKKQKSCRLCRVEFGSKIKKKNCRRCGDVFCENCCCYRRRLSPNCEPSADGHYYRVCYNCSDCAMQSLGQTRSLMEYFESQKASRHINVNKEIQRLVDGFKANIKASRFGSVVADTVSVMGVPRWQISEKWLESKEVEWCGCCSVKFTMLMQKHHCRLCGAVFCHKCCCRDLLLYYNDEGLADWAVIRVIGCPDVEPSICLYLRVCSQCREDAENLQVKRFVNTRANSEEVRETFGVLSSILDNFRSYQRKINRDLLFYQEMVEGMMDGQGKFKEVTESNQNVVAVFAKLQMDVSEHFSQYATFLYNLKKIKMVSEKEKHLLRNVSSVHYSYYYSNMSTFKFFKENLSKTVPADMLREVQNFSDKHAIIGCCITTRQLGLELLDICTRFNLEPTIAQRISEVENTCKDDLRSFVSVLGEDWDEYRGRLNVIVKQRFQSEKLISLQNLRDKNDNIALVKSLWKRCYVILCRVEKQLLEKSSETKFSRTKSVLRPIIAELEQTTDRT